MSATMPCVASECSMPTWMAPKLPPPAKTNAVFLWLSLDMNRILSKPSTVHKRPKPVLDAVSGPTETQAANRVPLLGAIHESDICGDRACGGRAVVGRIAGQRPTGRYHPCERQDRNARSAVVDRAGAGDS